MKTILITACFLPMMKLSIAQWTTGGSHIYNSNAGNVGIGTASPLGKLGIFQGHTTSNFPITADFQSNTLLDLGATSHWSTNQEDRLDFGGIGRIATYFDGVGFGLKLYSYNSSLNTSVTINRVGNVGIGMSSPDVLLTVSKSAEGTAFEAVKLVNQSSNQRSSSSVYIGMYGSEGSYERARILAGNPTDYSGADEYLSFFTRNANNLSEKLRITKEGNLGIGTISPSEKLSVNGNISAKKIIVTQIGWSDYVFDNTYKLKSLSSLETFIKQNKHLPELPSAKEVEEKGVNVGDNQALLLKKIEELTLYLIELNKQNKKQQVQIDELIKSKNK